MISRYQIELADNGMIIRRPRFGEVRCIEYKEAQNARETAPIAQHIGEDILDDMLESPDIQGEIEELMKQNGVDGVDAINDFEIIVEIKPIIK